MLILSERPTGPQPPHPQEEDVEVQDSERPTGPQPPDPLTDDQIVLN